MQSVVLLTDEHVMLFNNLMRRQRKEGDEADELLLLVHRLITRVKTGHGEDAHQNVGRIYVAYTFTNADEAYELMRDEHLM